MNLIQSSLSAIFTLVLCIFIFFVTQSTASLVFSILFCILGSVACFLLSKRYSNTVVILFNLVFSIYILLALNHYLEFFTNWDIFTQEWRDEYKFFLVAERNESVTLAKIFSDSFIERIYFEYGLYSFYISSIASLSYSYFDGNHLYLQLLGTAVFGVMISVVTFKMISFHVEQRRAFFCVIAFMLLSAFNTYSVSLLRDVQIAFYFCCGFYLILKSNEKGRNLRFLIMCLLNLLVWEEGAITVL